jgi:hypothetical protein
MDPTLNSSDERFREAVRRARRMSPEERILEGVRMFDEACADIKRMMRGHFSAATDEEVETLARMVIRYADRRGLI